jgi:hypothetical protein
MNIFCNKYLFITFYNFLIINNKIKSTCFKVFVINSFRHCNASCLFRIFLKSSIRFAYFFHTEEGQNILPITNMYA